MIMTWLRWFQSNNSWRQTFQEGSRHSRKKATKMNVKHQHDYCLDFFFSNNASNSIVLWRMLLSQASLYWQDPGVPTADVESAAKKSSPRMPWCTDSAGPKFQDGFVWQSSLRSSGFPNIPQVHHTNTLATVARLGPATRGIWTCFFLPYSMILQSTLNMAKHLDKIPVNLEVKRICFFQSTSYLRLLLHLEENRHVSGSPGSDICPCHRICSDAMWWTTWPKLRGWKRQKLH